MTRKFARACPDHPASLGSPAFSSDPKNMNRKINLPASIKLLSRFSTAAYQWEAYVGMDNSLKILKCTDFEIRVFAGGQGGNLNYALMKDLAAEKKLKERRDKARAKAPS